MMDKDRVETVPGHWWAWLVRRTQSHLHEILSPKPPQTWKETEANLSKRKKEAAVVLIVLALATLLWQFGRSTLTTALASTLVAFLILAVLAKGVKERRFLGNYVHILRYSLLWLSTYGLLRVVAADSHTGYVLLFLAYLMLCGLPLLMIWVNPYFMLSLQALGFAPDRMHEIRIGDSMDSVRESLGEPLRVEALSLQREIWIYAESRPYMLCQLNASVMFFNGSVQERIVEEGLRKPTGAWKRFLRGFGIFFAYVILIGAIPIFILSTIAGVSGLSLWWASAAVYAIVGLALIYSRWRSFNAMTAQRFQKAGFLTINPGDSREKVFEVLGRPMWITKGPLGEFWYYRWSPPILLVGEDWLVAFAGDQVDYTERTRKTFSKIVRIRRHA